ncbi:protein NLRC3-like [Paramormyrops kingsleyae]|uniref:protein NLRC3-like n=1 Tax=Paramormyrops kingsleyae TaxID=1676925 RepID=UPI003B972D43
MSMSEEQDGWDTASQSISLDIEDSDSEMSAGFEDEVQDPNMHLEVEGGAGASPMNLSQEFENAAAEPVLAIAPFESGRYWQETSSPTPSYQSMESDKDPEEQGTTSNKELLSTNTKLQLEEPDSPASSCYSFNSDDSAEPVRKPKPRSQNLQQATIPAPTPRPEVCSLLAPSEMRHPSITFEFMFSILMLALRRLAQEEFALFKRNLRRHYPEFFDTSTEKQDVLDLVDSILQKCGLDGSLRITLKTLTDMKLKSTANYLQELIKRREAQYELKLSLKRKYEYIFEGVAKQGEQTVFNDIFTDLYITEGGNGGVNKEHEIRQIVPPKRVKREVVVNCTEIFSLAAIEKQHTRSVLSRGIGGIGKSVCMQKFILDWAEERSHQHIYFLLPIPFRELNLMQSGSYSLMQLIHSFFPELKELESLDSEECKVLFICDGLEESHLPLNFTFNECWCDTTQPTTLDKLVTNLIKGNLLPSAHIWITSRPFRSSRIPPECIHCLLEVRGFNDTQKEEYFRKRLRDPELANRVIEHVMSMKTLHVMCHNPVFCWIIATVLERAFHSAGDREVPRTLTRFLTHFTLIQMKQMQQKYHGRPSDDKEFDLDFLLKLGKLAFWMLEKGEETLSETLWRESGVDFDDTVVHSGLCTEIYQEEFVMYQSKMYCFVHLTVQEYLAALYVFLSFKIQQKNVYETQLGKLSRMFKEPSLLDVHRCAIDKALQSENGHLDIFLRFLLGLSGESNQKLMRELLGQAANSSHGTEDIAQYINDKMRKHPEKSRILSLCLNELRS